MAKSKSSALNYSVHDKTKAPVTTGTERILKFTIVLLVSVLLLAGIIGAIIKYYRKAANQ